MVFSLILACLTKALAGIKVSGKLQHIISGTKKAFSDYQMENSLFNLLLLCIPSPRYFAKEMC